MNLACRVLGHEEKSLLGKQVSDLQRDSSEQSSEQFHENICAHDATFQSMEFVRADGSICPMDVTATMIPWSRHQAILLTLRDVTERRRTEEELRVASTYDALTGLYNRRQLMEQLEAATSGAKRYGFPLCLALCDVDEFKSVNDTYGHVAGDDVLAQFSTLAREVIRTEDSAGRYGGDEFCVVFPHVKASKAAHSLERIRERFGGANFQTGEE